MGLTQSALSLRRSLSSFFHCRASTETLLFKWEASREESLLGKDDAEALCIKTARMHSCSDSRGHDDVEGEFLTGEEEGLLMRSCDEGSPRKARRDFGMRNVASSDGMGHESIVPTPSYRHLQQEVENLRKEKLQLTKALCEVDAQTEALTVHCSNVMEENNRQLRAALQLVAELSGVVKYLKQDASKQADVIAELKMDKSMLNARLDAALEEIYKRKGTPTSFSMREQLLITPRSPQASSESSLSFQ